MTDKERNAKILSEALSYANCDQMVADGGRLENAILDAMDRVRQQEREAKWIPVEEAIFEDNEILLWCKVPIKEPPFVGSMCDEDFVEDYYTHIMKMPNEFFPAAPVGGEKGEGNE